MAVRAVDVARLSGMALRTLRSAKLLVLLRFAECAVMRVALILTTLLPSSLRYRSGTGPGALSDRGFPLWRMASLTVNLFTSGCK